MESVFCCHIRRIFGRYPSINNHHHSRMNNEKKENITPARAFEMFTEERKQNKNIFIKILREMLVALEMFFFI